MAKEYSPELNHQTTLLCGSDAELTLLEDQILEQGNLSVKRTPNAELVLEGSFAQACCGIVMTLDLAIKHLQPSESGIAMWGNVPLLVLLPGEKVDAEVGEHLLRCGVSGFLANQCGIEMLELALQRAKAGELWVSRGLMSSLIRQSLLGLGLHRLTEREHEVLQSVVEGSTNQEIAEKLFVTRETIRWHLRTVYGKLGVHSRDALLALMRTHEKAARG